MTTFVGDIQLTGTAVNNIGGTANLTGTLGVTLSATFNADGSGTGTETVNANISYTYAGGPAGPQSGSESFQFTTPSLVFQTGNFDVNKSLSVSYLGISLDFTDTGTVDLSQTQISENVSFVGSASYMGLVTNESISGSGVLNAVVSPTISAPAVAVAEKGHSSAIPNISVTDPNAGATVTVTVNQSYSTGSLSITQLGGTVTGGADNLQVTGNVTQVNADLATLQDFTNGGNQISLTVQDSFGGAPTGTDIAVFSLPAPTVQENLKGDNVSDLLMTNGNNGALFLDEVSGGSMTYTQVGGLGPEWQFEGEGAFLGDGKTQFLLYNSNNGAVFVGEDDNGTAQYTQIGGLGSEWEFVGNGPFLIQGVDDFLIYNTRDGALFVGTVLGGQAQYAQIGGLGSEWQFEGTGNYLGDGNTDFLIYNTSDGALFVGEDTNGAAQYTQIGGLGNEWQFEGSGYFLGNGLDDFLIWNSNTGALVVGSVSLANSQAQYTQIGSLGAGWQFLGTGDYDGASMAEFALRNSASGVLVIGTVANGGVTYNQVGGLGPEWNFHTGTIATVA